MVRSRSESDAAEARRPAERVGDRHRRDVPDVPVADGHREDLGLEALAAARRARPRDHVLLELGLDELRVGLAIASLEVRDHALEGGGVRVLAPLVAIADDDLLVLGGPQDVVDGLRGQVPDRGVDVPAVRCADGLEDLQPPRRVGRHLGPRHERALRDALGPVRDDEVRVDLETRPETGARGAGAVRGVEGEVARLELVDREPVVGAAVLLAVPALLETGRLAVHRRCGDQDLALAQPDRRLDRIGQPAGVRVRDDEPGLRVDRPSVRRARRALGRVGVADDVAVDDDLDRVALVLVELGCVLDVVGLAVDPDADEALAPGRLEDPVALGLAVLDERRQDEQPGAHRQGQHLVDDLLDALALDRVAVGAVRDADPGEQQPEVVVDLGDRPDGRARVARRALLVDGDRRREAVDLVDVGLLHLAEELARIGAQALDVPPLPLRVDRVEREAALARSGQPGDDDEAVARERDVDVLEVVLARAAHDKLILGHGPSVRDIT